MGCAGVETAASLRVGNSKVGFSDVIMTHSGGCGLAVVPSAVAVELAKETKGIGIRKVFWVECIAFPGPSAAADEGPGAPGTRLKNSKCKSKRNETVPQGLKAVIDLMDSTYGLKSVPFEVRLI
jgi:hypothetical protein